MTSITDSIYGTRSQYSSYYQTLITDSAYQSSSHAPAETNSGVILQNLLNKLDKVETALNSFNSTSHRVDAASASSQSTPATSTRMESIEEINSATPSHATANIVNPANAFNGNGRNSPNFEKGITVVEGSFLLNGVEISVHSNSSIYSVLSSINGSAADVTASYKSAEEKVVLTHNRLGAGSSINLTDDSSGFLRAIKLDNAPVERGVDAGVIETTNLKSRSYRTADMLNEINETLMAILEPSERFYNTALKNELQKIVGSIKDDYGTAQLKKSGIEFSDADSQLFKQNNNSRRRFVQALQTGDRFTLNALTANEDGKHGLIPSLKELVLEHAGSGYSGYSKGSITSYRA